MDEHGAVGRTERRAELGQQLRVDSVRAAAAAGSGHPTSSMSAADLAAVLLDGHLRYDFDDPANPCNDHLIFSKGHASPLLYSLYRAAGVVDERELLSFRKLGSRLEGHPTPRLPWVDVATGSLGQGLPVGVGVALAGRYLDRLPYRAWVLTGDSELAEGSMWEAFEHAAFTRLDNLIAVLDISRLGQTKATRHGWDTGAYAERLRAFGWHAIEIDGHDVDAIDKAYQEAVGTDGRPTAIVARTVKGKGVQAVENRNGLHGKPLDDPEDAIRELGGIRNLTVEVRRPPSLVPHRFPSVGELELPRFEVGDKVATRKAYGQALEALGAAEGNLVALDGEVGNSTYSELFANAHPERFFEMYIAEQQMIAAAVGMQVRGWRPFASAFAAFLTRAYDFIRMAAVSRADLRLCGSHAGVTVHEALEAADRLAERGVRARVIDCYSVKPIDRATLRAAAHATSRIVTVEDHWPEGGLGDAVLDAFADSRSFPRVVKLAVSGMPGSGKPAELLRLAGIDAAAIADAALALAEADRA